jgi:protocatechuate 3,4-dioxygenase beta subunit
VQGVVITWAALTSGDGHLINATSVTDNKGIAKTMWVLLADAGGAIVPTNIAHRVTATASMGQVEFQARVTPGRICGVAQDAISGATTINTAVNVSATVKDCNGFPVPGATVTFAVTAGSVAPAAQFSDASGRVSTTWTLGGTTGVQKINMTASGQADPYLGASFPTFAAASTQSVTVTPLPPAAVSATNPPASPSAASSVHSITFHVVDANGAPVVGQLVTFVATAGGGSVAPGSGSTDAAGNVTTSWTLGAAAATVNTLTATAGSVTATVNVSTP